jgi:hypothetical protein
MCFVVYGRIVLGEVFQVKRRIGHPTREEGGGIGSEWFPPWRRRAWQPGMRWELKGKESYARVRSEWFPRHGPVKGSAGNAIPHGVPSRVDYCVPGTARGVNSSRAPGVGQLGPLLNGCVGVCVSGVRRQGAFFCNDDWSAYLNLMGEWCREHDVETWTSSIRLPLCVTSS